jgi:hypothetical protein
MEMAMTDTCFRISFTFWDLSVLSLYLRKRSIDQLNADGFWDLEPRLTSY